MKGQKNYTGKKDSSFQSKRVDYSSTGFNRSMQKNRNVTQDIKQRSEVDSSKLHVRFEL